MLQPTKIKLLILLLLLLPACASRTPAPPAEIPAAQSQTVGEFIWQVDGDYGLALLRPAAWDAAAELGARVYTPGQPGLRLTTVNFQASEITEPFDTAHWEAFKQNPTLAGWTTEMEKSMLDESGNPNFKLERSLPNARIYALPVGGGSLRLMAFVVADHQPILLTLDAEGDWASLDRLKQEKVFDDYVTMVESIQAAPIKRGDTIPPLPHP